jgi:DNA polymerase III delta subunit
MRKKSAGNSKARDQRCLGKWCLLYGAEQHLKREALEGIRKEAREIAGDEEPSWEVLDGPSATARDILNRSQTGALFGGVRVVVVREAERLAAPEQDALTKGVGPLPAGVTVVLVTGEAGDRSRRRAIRAALRRAVEKEGLSLEFAALKVPEATRWAIERAKQLGKKLEPSRGW